MNDTQNPRKRGGSRGRRVAPVRVGLALAISLGLIGITGCTAVAASSSQATTGATTEAAAATSDASAVQAILDANADQTVVNDDEWSADDAVDIALSGTTATTDAAGVTVSSGTVTITKAGVYRLSGDFTGSIVVKAADDAQVVLILDGVDIAATDAPAIQVDAADDVAISLAAGSKNTVASTGSYAEDAANAAIYSEADLTLSGTGSLTVNGSAEDGITSKDDLVILSGTISVTAEDDGLRGKDSLTVRGGTISLTAGGDGLQSNQDSDETKGYVDIEGGTIDITAGSDGIDAYTDAVILDGKVTIDSEEGIEGGTVAIGGGTIDITSSDDGINGSAGKSDSTSSDGGGMGGGGMQDTGELVLIAGGTITIDAEGDGLDSNGSMQITGGTTVVYGPTRSGNGGLDTNGAFTVSGGTVISLDAGGMSESPDADSAQAWVAASASGSAGSVVEIADSDGTVVAKVTAKKSFAAVVFSSPEVTSGATYTVKVDGSTAATVQTGQAISGGGGMGGGNR